MSLDYFGYLGKKESYIFDGGKITVVDDFDSAWNWVKKYANRDGFVYPPSQRNYRRDPITREGKEIVPNTERPALLHNMPVSHSIELIDGGGVDEQRKGPSGFLIHLLGFILGYRLQFHDWWLDGRVPIHGNNGFHVHRTTVEDFLSHCFSVWKDWNTTNQQLVTNILFMFARAVHYEWDWERFAVEYMVIDGLWKLSCDLRGVKASYTPHTSRIRKLCEIYGIPANEDYIEKAVSLRKDLFHETLWDKGQPCSAGSDEAILLTVFLRNLTTRIIPAIFDYRTPFINTGWWYLGQCAFDRPVN